MSFHPLCLYSIASKYLDNLAWYFGSSPLSVDVSWEEGRGAGGSLEGLKERGEGEEWAGYSRHLSSVSLWAQRRGRRTCIEGNTHSHTSSHIFTACSSDWQQQTELRASTTERGRKRIGDKGGIHRGWRGEERERICPFFSLFKLSGSHKRNLPTTPSWTELALHPAMAVPVGHGNTVSLSSYSSHRWTILLWAFLTLLSQVWGFNLDTTHTLHKLGDHGTFFGFSLALHQQLTPEPQSW